MSAGDELIEAWYEHTMSELNFDSFFYQVQQKASWATSSGVKHIGCVCEKCNCTFDWYTPGPIINRLPEPPRQCGGTYCHRNDPAAKDLSEFDALMAGQLSPEQYQTTRTIGRRLPELPPAEGWINTGMQQTEIVSKQADQMWYRLSADHELDPYSVLRDWLFPRLVAMLKGMLLAVLMGFIVAALVVPFIKGGAIFGCLCLAAYYWFAMTFFVRK